MCNTRLIVGMKIEGYSEREHDGVTGMGGYVMVKYDGEWSSVCDDDWGDQDAR